MRRLGKGAVGLRPVAKLRVHQDVIGDLVPYRRCAGLERVLGVDDERQFLVFDFDRLGGVHRLRTALGHHHRHRFADVAGLVGRQQHVRSDEHVSAAGCGELHVEFGLRHRCMRDRLYSIGQAVRAGQHGEHARHRLGGACLDPHDARMRIGRAHHRRECFAVEAKVVGEAALAGEQPPVLLAADRMADRAEGGAGGKPQWLVHATASVCRRAARRKARAGDRPACSRACAPPRPGVSRYPRTGILSPGRCAD